MQALINLYSQRYSIAKGWHWKLERACLKENAEEWLKVFRDDEPAVIFKLSDKEPKTSV